MKACFIGHRAIEKTDKLVNLLRTTILMLIKKGVTTFLFGSKSEFDNLSWEVVTELKKEHPYIKRVYVRSAYQHIDESYEKYLLRLYEETYFPDNLEKAGRYSYVERNYEMIDRATYCVFYYNEKYVVKVKSYYKNSRIAYSRNSGTQLAYKYAVKNKKKIINLFE